MSRHEELARLEHQVGRVLKNGVMISASLFIIGLITLFAHLPGATYALDAGIIVLMAIPVTRILASFVDALRRRDHLLSGATATVLVILCVLLVYAIDGSG